MTYSWAEFLENILIILDFDIAFGVSMMDVLKVGIVIWVVGIVVGFLFNSEGGSNG